MRATRRGLIWAGASAALVAGLSTPRFAAALARNDVHQAVWDEDQANNGVPALTPDARRDSARGFVVVDEAGRGAQHRVLAEVAIPDDKRTSYQRFTALLDNYRLNQRAQETATRTEANELFALLGAVAASAPMRPIRELAADTLGASFADEAGWQEWLFNVWFRPFALGRNRDLTGFEHIALGEQRDDTLGGQHFWYAYHLADRGLWGQAGDAIDFGRTQYPRRLIEAGRGNPDIVTLSYRWQATDPENGRVHELSQEIGGFWVGPSIEGLMALGTLRFLAGGDGVGVPTVINGQRYEVVAYFSPDGRSLRTFYPVYRGPA